MQSVVSFVFEISAGIKINSPIKRSTIVCVTDQYSCERLICAGRKIADLSKTELLVIHVSHNNLKPSDALAINHLFQISKQNKASMHICYENDTAKALIRFIKENHGVNVLSGEPCDTTSVLYKIWNKFTHIAFFTVNSNGIPLKKPA